MTDYPTVIAFHCRHCGPIATTDAVIIRGTVDIVRGLAQGHAPLGAITCPLCHDEVRAKDVAPVPPRACEVCGETGCTKAECADAAVRR